ncbi:MAG: three-Cys-motif partner protein TcmP [Planctomycetota bacterium]|nr:three-Cys-motif partner protein TcmP [Planctomycetota bacterium]
MAATQMQMFGGDWTEQKLTMLKEYLHAYTTALKNTTFSLAYIDAFAGTGYRELKENIEGQTLLPFEELAQEDPQKFLDGSARIALQAKPAFSRYVFIEKHRRRFAELEKLKNDFPAHADAIELYNGDANEYIQDWCEKCDWREWRAVLFLDPFGMQIDWVTMEAVAKTQAIDVWITFPLGVGVNRLLTKDPAMIPPSWRSRLNRMFGSDDWFDIFYKERVSRGLLGENKEISKDCTFETISKYYQDKLKTVFAKVADNPRVLSNSTGNPIFQLHFAAGNPGRGGEIAKRIAQHILKEKEHGD